MREAKISHRKWVSAPPIPGWGDFGEYLITLQILTQYPQVQGACKFCPSPQPLPPAKSFWKLEVKNHEWQLDRRIWLLLMVNSLFTLQVLSLQAKCYGLCQEKPHSWSQTEASTLSRNSLPVSGARPDGGRRAPGLLPLSHQGQTTLMSRPPFQVSVCASGSCSKVENKSSGTFQMMWVSVAIFLQK